jgi:phosphoenolpyruvate carboxykinase (GTP)
MSSETTVAQAGEVGKLRFDPMAMLPFCGYHMGDYFAHWLSVGAMTDPAKLPRIYHVNWFRKNAAGRFTWPGYGENSRVLKWICQRLSGQAAAVPTPIGNLPADGALDTSGLQISEADLEVLLSVDPAAWLQEADLIGEHLATFGRRLPEQLWEEHDELLERLKAAR